MTEPRAPRSLAAASHSSSPTVRALSFLARVVRRERFCDASTALLAGESRLLCHDLDRHGHPSRAIASAAIRAPHQRRVIRQTPVACLGSAPVRGRSREAPLSASRDPARSGDQPLVEPLLFDRRSSHNISVWRDGHGRKAEGCREGSGQPSGRGVRRHPSPRSTQGGDKHFTLLKVDRGCPDRRGTSAATSTCD